MGTLHWPYQRLALLSPPYEDADPIDLSWTPTSLPPRGRALVWSLVDGKRQAEQYHWLHRRPPGLPLVVILPPAAHIAQAMPLLNHLGTLAPRAILPSGPVSSPARVRTVLTAPPYPLAKAVTDYLIRRGLLETERIQSEVKSILELSPVVSSVSQLVKRLFSSRRTLGRHFSMQGLPAPSHWLQFGRLMHVAVRLQSDSSAAFRIALRAGYPDGFTMSNQMKRLMNCRPTEVRRTVGWEWLVEAWISQEVQTGGIDSRHHLEVVHVYLQDRAHRDASKVAERYSGSPYLHVNRQNEARSPDHQLTKEKESDGPTSGRS